MSLAEVSKIVDDLGRVRTIVEVQLCIMRLDKIFHNFEKEQDISSMKIVLHKAKDAETIIRDAGLHNYSCAVNSWLLSHNC